MCTGDPWAAGGKFIESGLEPLQADDIRGHSFYPADRLMERVPRLYATEEVDLEGKVVHLHYFVGGCDWYVMEVDEHRQRAVRGTSTSTTTRTLNLATSTSANSEPSWSPLRATRWLWSATPARPDAQQPTQHQRSSRSSSGRPCMPTEFHAAQIQPSGHAIVQQGPRPADAPAEQPVQR